jgi:hypothetical protein
MCRDCSGIGDTDRELRPGEGGFRKGSADYRPRLRPAGFPFAYCLLLDAHNASRRLRDSCLKAQLSLSRALLLHSGAVSPIGNQDEKHTDEGKSVAGHVQVHGVLTVPDWARRRSRTRLTAMARGPSTEQPLAHLCPPPPKCSATVETLTAPLLRRLTR